MMANLSGHQLGNYRLLHLLGQGGFAEVYLGKHIYLNTQAAIKILRAQLAKDELESFLNEARTIAHLQHSHIVRVLDFGVSDSIPFLAMEYAPNGSLRQRHPKGTTLVPVTILSYIKQIGDGLQFAHDKKLVHRDIKPENMLLGQSNTILISDFGIATVAHSTHSQSIQEVMGTAPYMAPEQLQGRPRPASDQYSLAVVVYEWLCGNRPFHGTFTELYSQHMFVPPPPIHEKVPGISQDIEQVVITALSKDPQQRFTNILAFVKAFEQAVESINESLSPSTHQPPTSSTTIPSIQPAVEVFNSYILAPTQPVTPVSPPSTYRTPPQSGTFTPPQPPARSKYGLSRRAVLATLAGLAVTGGGITLLTLSHKQQGSSSNNSNRNSSPTSPVQINNSVGPLDMQTLITQAKQEGQLQAIGIPPEWADYADILAGYSRNYGIPITYKTEAEYSSAQELVVFKNSQTQPYGDIGDVGFKFGPDAVQQGLIVPYKHANWGDIDPNLKDPNGYWCTEYYGAQAFVINTDIVKNPPTSFQDLLNNNYPNMIGIDGDPRQANDAFSAVFSAALANGGSLDNIQPGIDFFKRLKQKGNFIVARSSNANIASGQVPISIMWDYLGLEYRDQLKGHPNLSVVIPSDASIGGPYVSVVNKTSPHPYAARLWIEYIFSDAGQLFFLKGYVHPARYQKLVANNKIPPDLAAKLPSAAQYTHIQFPNANQITAASNVVAQNWGSQVLGS